MAREGITFEQVAAAADALVGEGRESRGLFARQGSVAGHPTSELGGKHKAETGVMVRGLRQGTLLAPEPVATIQPVGTP